MTKEDFYTAGYVHGHGKEYEKVYNNIYKLLGEVNLLAGFASNGDICFSSS